ncbi:MAG TPA: TIGR00282 family metallophosphoesterase [Thermoleophilia bacterium]|nr:TIGR00282 family metallophosphoesterase [Thermoleophilia bacterium]
MNILFLGDVFGQPGRDAVVRELPALVAEHEVDFVIANGENVANGAGITSKLAQKLLAGGVDVITTGNHIWRQREVYPFLDSSDRIVRPANFPPSSPGRGLTVRATRDGDEIAVVNLMGQVFTGVGISPFRIVDALVDEAQTLSETIVVDFHAEATSEKVAMAQYLDGRVTAVIGTHTHVQTADERVSERGTAAITDVGMCGPRDSVIGVRSEIILRRFLSELPAQFEVAEGDVRINAVVVAVQGGRATAIERLERRC